MTANEEYILSHTPRQLAENEAQEILNGGEYKLHRLYQEHCFRLKDKLVPMEYDFMDYLDHIPDDDYFKDFLDNNYQDNPWDITAHQLKLTFTVDCAVKYLNTLRIA